MLSGEFELDDGGNGGDAHFHIAAPLVIDGQVAAVLLVTVELRHDLFPLIETWPAPGLRGENLLVHRQGEDVVFLTARRKGQLLSLSLQTPKLAAAAAALGRTGLFEGRDYQGTPVIAYLRPIPDTDWILVTKAEREAALDAPRRTAALTSLLVGLLLLATGIAIEMSWRTEQGRRQAVELQAAAERAALTTHYEHLVKYANDIFLLADENHRVVEANARALEAYGYSRDELIGISIRDLRADAYRACLEQDLKRIVADRTVYHAVQRRKDGSTFPVEISGSVFEVDGHRYYQGIIRDVSERRQAEETLASSRRRFLALLDSIPDITWMKDADGRILAANEAYARTIGMPIRDIVGKTDAGLWPPDMADRFRAGDDKVMHDRAPLCMDQKMTTEDGERWYETIVTPMFDTAGRVVGTTGIARDITERYQARQALEESESRYRNFVELTPDAVAVVSLEGNIVSANHAGLKMFGLDSADQVVGQSMYRFVPEDQRSSFDQHLADLMTRGALREIESEYQRADGTRFSAQVSTALIGSDHGQPPVMTAIIRDISERKHHEAELLAVNRALRVLSECNAALVRATGEAELFAQVCEILTTTGGYRLAWVGALEHDGVLPMHISWALGERPEQATWGKLTRADNPQALMWAALERRQPMLIQDLQQEPRRHWHAEMLNCGLKAFVHLPLIEHDQAFGLLCVASTQPYAFSATEVKLLAELAGDLAFGIGALKTRKARDQALEALNASEAKLSNILQHTSDGIVMTGPDGRVLYANSAAERLLADGGAPLVGRALDIPLPQDAPLDLTIHDGQIATVELSVAQTEWAGQPARIVALRDVTVRRQMEEERKGHLQQLQRALIQTISAMALTVEKRDPYTAGHQSRVAQLAVAIARELGLPEDRLQGIRLGAMIHDIGKIYIPAEILNRPGRLTEPELNLIRTHVGVGYDIVKDIDFIWPVKEMILQHHERMDGSGYPAGLKGDQIILEARILAVADVVEAMGSHRPYRPALGVERGLEEIRLGCGTAFDAEVVAVCLRLFEQKRFEFSSEHRSGG